jgi:hypothetical protein
VEKSVVTNQLGNDSNKKFFFYISHPEVAENIRDHFDLGNPMIGVNMKFSYAQTMSIKTLLSYKSTRLVDSFIHK